MGTVKSYHRRLINVHKQGISTKAKACRYGNAGPIGGPQASRRSGLTALAESLYAISVMHGETRTNSLFNKIKKNSLQGGGE